MAKRTRKGGRVTPKGTRPPHPRAVDDPPKDDSPLDHIIDSGGRGILDEDDPIQAEIWGSSLLDMFEGAREQARNDHMEVPPFEQALLHRCRQRRDQRAWVVAAALASVLPPAHGRLARSISAELQQATTPLPAWVRTIGAVTPTRSWIALDVFGDQDSLIVGFRHEGQPGEHALVVLVDHNLAGQAKDAWLGPHLLDVVATWTSTTDPHMQVREVPIGEGLRRLRDAMAMSDLWNGDTDLRTEDFARSRALIWARLRRAGISDDRPSHEDVSETERDDLVTDFVASADGRQLRRQQPGVDVAHLARQVVNLRCDYEGRPLRWSPTVVSLVLGDLAPRKLLLDGEEAAALPDVVRAFVRFSAERAGLERGFVEETLAAVDELEAEFLDRVSDPSLAGPAKAMLATLQARGVDITDLDALTEAMDEINEAMERGAPFKLPEAAPKQRPRPAAPPPEVIVSAERAPVLARFDLLADFYDEGRKITQTGRPTLADAKALVSLLGTNDRTERTFGDRTYKTQSAAELLELSFMLRWALAAGALRKERAKFRATASWRNLADEPVRRWLKATDALALLGPLAAFHANNRYRSGNEILDEFTSEILHRLEQSPEAFEQVLDWVCERAETEYEWRSPFMQDPEHRRSVFGWDLARLAMILGWAGIADRIGAKVEVDRYSDERLIGGTLQLTRVGRWWLTGN